MNGKELRPLTGFTFANQQSNAESWYRSAVSFHEGASVLQEHADSIPGGVRVFLANAALSIELLLKAIIVASGKIPRNKHKLLELARDAGVVFSESQEATLELLGEVLIWSGRYPVPMKEGTWDDYYDHVLERHVIREREGNVSREMANRETFPSVENYERLWDLANQKWAKFRFTNDRPR